ncbi:TPA: hypothetical protein DF272_00230 [Candidatus Falkowbacteria bacterium]|nr:hypothetical protein [Candidatus Falkowbacteria bacterium]
MSKSHIQKVLSPQQIDSLISLLKNRFEKNMSRHQGIDWAKLQTKLKKNTAKLWSLNEMEKTGGEPDVVGYDQKTKACLGCDPWRKFGL